MNWNFEKSLNIKYKRTAEQHVTSATQLLPSPPDGGVVNPPMDFRPKRFYVGHASQGCLVWNIKPSNYSRHSNSTLIFLVPYPFDWVHLSPSHFFKPEATLGLDRCFCCTWIFKQLMKAIKYRYTFLLTTHFFSLYIALKFWLSNIFKIPKKLSDYLAVLQGTYLK
jgi:hypothetical protein